MNKTIKISGKKYPLAYNIRAIIAFEKIADKPFQITGVSDWVVLMYACLLSADKELDIVLDEFIDKVDQSEITGCIEWLTKEVRDSALTGNGGSEKSTEKGKTVKA